MDFSDEVILLKVSIYTCKVQDCSWIDKVLSHEKMNIIKALGGHYMWL